MNCTATAGPGQKGQTHCCILFSHFFIPFHALFQTILHILCLWSLFSSTFSLVIQIYFYSFRYLYLKELSHEIRFALSGINCNLWWASDENIFLCEIPNEPMALKHILQTSIFQNVNLWYIRITYYMYYYVHVNIYKWVHINIYIFIYFIIG